MTVNSPEPMGASEIVGTGWRLYTSNLPQYLSIALVATIWSSVPTVLNLLMTLGPVYLGTPLSPGLSILLFVVWVAIAIFCTAQSLGQFAGISRLAYQSLSNTAESAEESLRFTCERRFSFLGATILQSLIIFIAVLALMILYAIFVGILAAVLSAVADSPILVVFFGVLSIAGIVALFFAYLYIVVRFMLIEQPIAIEPSSGVLAAISRSWELTGLRVGRSMLVFFLLFLIVFAISIVILGAIGIAMSGTALAILTSNPDPEEMMRLFWPFYIAILATSVAISLGVMPLFKTASTVLYFDLRNQFERRNFRATIQSNPTANL